MREEHITGSVWRLGGSVLYRLVERYSVSHVLSVVEKYSVKKSYEIVYGAEIPYVSVDEIYRHLLPEKRLYEIYTMPRDELEYIVAELIDVLRDEIGISLQEIGVSGSILGGFHNPVYSDIDLVVYGCENTIKIYDSVGSVVESLRDRDLERWLYNQASLHMIDMDTAREMYHVYRRGVFMGRHVAFIFPRDRETYPPRYVSRPVSCVRTRLYVSERQCRALQYPGEADVDRVFEVSGVDREVSRELKKVYIYEGAFSPILFRGGLLEVEGSLQRVYDFMTGESYYVVSVGTRECRSSVRRLG